MWIQERACEKPKALLASTFSKRLACEGSQKVLFTSQRPAFARPGLSQAVLEGGVSVMFWEVR